VGVALLFCIFASTVFAQKQADSPPPAVLSPEQAATEGRALAAEIVAQRPAENSQSVGVMTIRDAQNKRTQIPIRFSTVLTPTNWLSVYEATESGDTRTLTIAHNGSAPGRYQMSVRTKDGSVELKMGAGTTTNNIETLPFAGSDFSLGDLGLEFFHWPDQKLIKKEMKRSRSCKVLESVNPKPASGAYSRVDSWIDNDSDGIVMAQAYDRQGNLLKQFIPKKVKKVEGQWQLEEMEIDNTQTGSSTRVDFDLSHP
jgi:YD repeat-containing protein